MFIDKCKSCEKGSVKSEKFRFLEFRALGITFISWFFQTIFQEGNLNKKIVLFHFQDIFSTSFCRNINKMQNLNGFTVKRGICVIRLTVFPGLVLDYSATLCRAENVSLLLFIMIVVCCMEYTDRRYFPLYSLLMIICNMYIHISKPIISIKHLTPLSPVIRAPLLECSTFRRGGHWGRRGLSLLPGQPHRRSVGRQPVWHQRVRLPGEVART